MKEKLKEKVNRSKFEIKKDEIENIFFSRLDIAADLLNGYYYYGEEIIESYNLEPYDPYGTDVDEITHESSELRRDILFKMSIHFKNGQDFVFLKGIEVETKKNYHMFYRVQQYNARTNKRIIETTRNDYIVDTLVVTTSKIRWEKTTLYDLYDVPKEIQPMISDMPFHVLNLRTANPEWFHHPELKALVTWFNAYNKSKEEGEAFLRSLGSLPKHLAYMIASLTLNEKLFEMIEKEKGDVVEVEEIFESYYYNGFDKGFDKGFDTGIDKGILDNTIENLVGLMKNTGWTLNVAMDMNEVSEELRPAVNEWFSENGY